MRLHGIKIRLSIIVSSLLLISMLLVNIVLIVFWQRDALQREINHDKAVLAHVQDLLPAEASTLYSISPDFFPFEDFYSCKEIGRILIYTENENPFSYIPSDYFAPFLVEAITETMHTGNHVVHYSGSLLGLINFRRNVLVNALPIIREGKIVGAAGVVRTLKPMFHALCQAEKIVLVYILINLLVLTVIGFFRMTKLVVQPIERLVWLADRYDDQESVLFATSSPGSEFGKLTNSLNSMLARIEHDRKSLEETVAELADANLKLKTHHDEMIRTEKLASVGRMAAGLAHEIGNPLGVVQGYLGLLARPVDLSDEYKDFIRRAEQELQRVNALIRQMLNFAGLSKGEPRNFSLHSLLRSVVEMVQVQPIFNEIKLVCKLDAAEDTVYADQDQLHQVFVNCLLNSADAVAASNIRKEGVVIVSTDVYKSQHENDQVQLLRIQIKDNGIGIAKEQLAVIFDPFYTTKEPGKGTGLGLSVSLSIIESMAGKIEIESKEGQGCLLSVFIPITDRYDV